MLISPIILLRRVISILVLSNLLSGCIQLDQEITITDQNAGKFRIELSIPTRILESVKLSEDELRNDMVFRFFDPQSGSMFFSDEDGLEIRQYRVYERGVHTYVRIKGDINDLRKAIRSKKLGNFMLTEDSEGSVTLRLGHHWGEQILAAQDLKLSDEKKTVIKDLLGQMRLSLSIKVPGKITDTSATDRSKKTATWIFDPSKNDQFLFNPQEIFVSYRK